MIPFVYKEGKVFFFHKAQGDEVQEYCDKSVMIYGPDPDKYTYSAGVVTPVTKQVSTDLDAATKAILDAEKDRLVAISAAQETARLKQVTIEQAEAFIAAQFNTDDLVATLPALHNATDLQSAMSAIIATFTELYNLIGKAKEAHLAEIPYILD